MAQKTTRQERRRIAEEYQQAGKEFAKIKYEDDRTPFVKKIDPLTKLIACFLTIVFFICLNVVIGGGGYDYSKVVPVMGIANCRVSSSFAEIEIEKGTMVFINTKDKGAEGDAVLYKQEKNYDVGKIKMLSSDGSEYTVYSEASTDAVISADDISGRIIGKTKSLSGIIAFFQTGLGLAVTGVAVFFLLLLPDILMFKKRKAQAEIEKEKYRKKKEMDLKRRMGREEKSEPAPKFKAQEKIEEKKEKKQAKIKEETEVISREMSELRRQMAEEEAELDRILGSKKRK